MNMKILQNCFTKFIRLKKAGVKTRNAHVQRQIKIHIALRQYINENYANSAYFRGVLSKGFVPKLNML